MCEPGWLPAPSRRSTLTRAGRCPQLRQGRQVTGPILVINAGSSSIKFELFDIGTGDGLERRLKGQIDGIGTRPRLAAKGVSGDVLVDERYEAKEVRT